MTIKKSLKDSVVWLVDQIKNRCKWLLRSARSCTSLSLREPALSLRPWGKRECHTFSLPFSSSSEQDCRYSKVKFAHRDLYPSLTASFRQDDGIRYRASQEIHSLQHLLGLPRGLFPVEHAWNTSTGRHPRNNLTRWQKHHSWLLLMQRSSYSNPLPDDRLCGLSLRG